MNTLQVHLLPELRHRIVHFYKIVSHFLNDILRFFNGQMRKDESFHLNT